MSIHDVELHPNAGGVYGAQVGSLERPNDWVADIDSHRDATPERLERARQLFTELEFSELDVHQTGPERFSLVDRDGVEYRIVDGDPLQAADLSGSNIAGFTVDAGNSLLFLRRRDQPQQPSERVLVGYVREMEVPK